MSNWYCLKGGDFERLICRRLSGWLSRGESVNWLWRSSQSGGRATILRRKGIKLSVHAGDVAAIDPAAHSFTDTYFIECKCVNDLRLDLLLYDVKGELGQMWGKCCYQAAQYEKIPLLIFRERRKATMLCFPTWLSCAPPYEAVFPRHSLGVGRLEAMEGLDPDLFISLGGVDAHRYYSRPASDEPAAGQLPVGPIQVVGGFAVPHTGNTRRPRRRERLSL